MKNIILILTILIFCSNIYGQQSLGIKMNGGVSNVRIVSNNGQILTRKFYPQSSFQGGIYYAVDLPHKLKFGAELLFTKINGKENIIIPFTDNNNNPTDQYYSNTNWRHLPYLGLPIYVGYNYKKLVMNIGLQTNIRLGGNVREIGSIPLNGDTLTFDNRFTELGFDGLDFGIRAGLIIDIYKKFGIEGNYYFGLNNNFKGSITSNWKMKNRQLTVGIRYKCFTIKRKTKEKK